MPRKTDFISIGNTTLKRSSKLLPCQKEMMHFHYEAGMSIHGISRLFKCNKRTVQFELFPERHELNLALRDKRGGSKKYYKKSEHTPAIKKHRDYKEKLFNPGKS